jgi:hypothetical protein
MLSGPTVYNTTNMKKIATTTIIAATGFAAHAQGRVVSIQDERPMLEVLGTITLVAMVMFTILTLFKRVMDYRLKNKLIDKGISDAAIASILQVDPNENRNVNIKWFAILAGIGTALTIIYYTQPLGIHSLAIMAFCLSISFLGYYFFLKQSGK